jgi:hypothetical protein
MNGLTRPAGVLSGRRHGTRTAPAAAVAPAWRVHRRPCVVAAASAGDALSSQAILDRFQAMLHDYRSTKTDVGSWLQDFQATHGRRPSLRDAAGVDASLRDRLQSFLSARQVSAPLPPPAPAATCVPTYSCWQVPSATGSCGTGPRATCDPARWQRGRGQPGAPTPRGPPSTLHPC